MSTLVLAVCKRLQLTFVRPADPFHSYLALAALALIEEERSAADHASQSLGLKPLCPLWNVSKATRTYMEAQTALL